MKIAVVGSGFSSLSAACYLARDGHDVTILERLDQPGGRARQLKKDGFTFDIGPTWYWMPDIFENFFRDFNRNVNDYYGITRLNPSYRIYSGVNEFEDIPADKKALEDLFEKYQPGSGLLLREFLKQAAVTYNLAVKEMAFKSGSSLFEFVSTETVSNAHLFVHSLRSQVRKKFKHPFLVSLLEFPVLFLGAKPGDIPAFYNFMNYADLELGTWYPDGGMYSVVEAMVKLAKELGVRIETSCDVQKLEVNENYITGIITGNGIMEADAVISGADYQHTESLLDKQYRNYSDSYWEKKTFAPSALLFFLGLNKKLDNIRHHDLFFDESFDVHASSIYDNPEWPEKPLFYINVPSVTDKTVAPEGCEAITVLIPLAPGLADTSEIRNKYFEMIVDRFERITGENIKNHLVMNKSYCINDFKEDYNAYKGNAYGLANTFFQTGYFRPKITSKKINNLFFCGQLTVPGGGVPPALISGKIAAGELKKSLIYELNS